MTLRTGPQPARSTGVLPPCDFPNTIDLQLVHQGVRGWVTCRRLRMCEPLLEDKEQLILDSAEAVGRASRLTTKSPLGVRLPCSPSL